MRVHSIRVLSEFTLLLFCDIVLISWSEILATLLRAVDFNLALGIIGSVVTLKLLWSVRAMGRSPKHKTIRIKQTRLPSSVVLVPRGISLSRTSQVKPYGPTYGYSSYRVLSPAAYVGLFIVLLFLLFIYLGYYCITRMEEDEIEIEYDAESENTGNYDQQYDCEGLLSKNKSS